MNEKQKLFTRHSIGTRIAALFMLLILVITGVMTYVSISVSTSELLDSSTDYTEQLILRVNAELDMYVEYMKDISDFIVDNGAVAAYLQAANEHRLTDAACRGAQQQLAAALSRLPSHERALFYRKYWYRQPTAQIAAELGLSPRAVEGRLYRIRQKLRQELGGDFCGE